MTIEIINELRRCVELREDGVCKEWDIWYKSVYLGTIQSFGKGYLVHRDNDTNFLGVRKTFMAAISCYIRSAKKVNLDITNAALREACNNVPDLKVIGLREPKSVWQKIKGWFK